MKRVRIRPILFILQLIFLFLTDIIIAFCYQDTMEASNWWEQNNNGQDSTLNPGNEETCMDWIEYMDYDIDDLLIPEDNENTDQVEGRPPNRGKRFTNEQLDIFER